MTNAAQPTAPVEDINRGTLLALVAIPVGIIAFVIIWNLGFIASIVTLGVAYLAIFLYQRGSGGTIGRAGAVRVAIITIVTICLSIFAGIVSSVAIGFGEAAGISPFAAIADPQFGTIFSATMADTEVQGELVKSVLIALAFGALGCFFVLRSVFRATATPQAAPPVGETPAS
jgi:hypothetical protein